MDAAAANRCVSGHSDCCVAWFCTLDERSGLCGPSRCPGATARDGVGGYRPHLELGMGIASRASGKTHLNACMCVCGLACHREKLKARAQAGSSRLGGKGTMRRNTPKSGKKSTTSANDVKLQSQMKKLRVHPYGVVDEVVMAREGTSKVLNFSRPKLWLNFQSRTYVVQGRPEEKEAMDLQSVLSRLGASGGIDQAQLAQLQAILAAQTGGAGPAAAAAGGGAAESKLGAGVSSFEDIAEED